MPTVISNVRPWGGDLVDLVVDEGVVTALAPAGTAADADAVIDGAGQVVVPSFADVHNHLDSSRLGLPFRPHTTGGPGLWGAIENDRANWRSAEWTVSERTTYTLGRMIALGATKVRSYAQIDADSKLERFEGVCAARAAHADRADVQIIAFPQAGIHREPGVVELLDEALATGADIIGGIDPCGLDGDPVRHLDTVFALAEKHHKPIDVHLHEPGTLGLFSLGLIVDRVAALGLQGQVTISHAFCLADASVEVSAMIDRLAELDVSVATVAPGRGLDLPVVELVRAGVRLGLGMDGQRDYWHPYGNADMFDRAYQLAFTQGFVADPDLELALAVATWGGASVIDASRTRVDVGSRPGVAVGDPADLVLFPAESIAAGLMDRPAGRTVFHAGVQVAVDGQLR